LVPGHHYFFTAMVIDAAGNWEVMQREFDTLKRKLIVQFPKIVVFNDGDDMDYGGGEFWFRVAAGSSRANLLSLEEFHLPTMDIDDWSKTGRPYTVGFAYVEPEPQTVAPKRTGIWVASWAIEHDGIGEANEAAGLLEGQELFLPVGPSEVVTNQSFMMDCPARSAGLARSNSSPLPMPSPILSDLTPPESSRPQLPHVAKLQSGRVKA
jgi:hypothetical protein